MQLEMVRWRNTIGTQSSRTFSFSLLLNRLLPNLLRWITDIALLISAAMTAKLTARNLGNYLPHPFSLPLFPFSLPGYNFFPFLPSPDVTWFPFYLPGCNLTSLLFSRMWLHFPFLSPDVTWLPFSLPGCNFISFPVPLNFPFLSPDITSSLFNYLGKKYIAKHNQP